jgi:hypothetical protein
VTDAKDTFHEKRFQMEGSFVFAGINCHASDDVINALVFGDYGYGFQPQIELLGSDVIGDADWSEVALFSHKGAYLSNFIGFIQVLGNDADKLAKLLNLNLSNHDAYARLTAS